MFTTKRTEIGRRTHRIRTRTMVRGTDTVNKNTALSLQRYTFPRVVVFCSLFGCGAMYFNNSLITMPSYTLAAAAVVCTCHMQLNYRNEGGGNGHPNCVPTELARIYSNTYVSHSITWSVGVMRQMWFTKSCAVYHSTSAQVCTYAETERKRVREVCNKTQRLRPEYLLRRVNGVCVRV